MEQVEYKQIVAHLDGLTDEQFDALLEMLRQRKETDGMKRLVMARFHGVATKYLGWRRLLDRFKDSLTPQRILFHALRASYQ